MTPAWHRLPVLLTLLEAATPSRLSTWTLRQAIHGGELAAIHVGKRLLVAHADLEAFLQRPSHRAVRTQQCIRAKATLTEGPKWLIFWPP